MHRASPRHESQVFNYNVHFAFPRIRPGLDAIWFQDGKPESMIQCGPISVACLLSVTSTRESLYFSSKRCPPFLALFRLLLRPKTILRKISYIQGFYSSERFPVGERQRDTVGGLGEGRGSSDSFLMKKKGRKREKTLSGCTGRYRKMDVDRARLPWAGGFPVPALIGSLAVD